MGNEVIQNYTANLILDNAASSSFQAKDKVIGYFKSFQQSMADIMNLLGDNEDKPLSEYDLPSNLKIPGGVTTSAELKSNLGFQMALSSWQADQEMILSQLLDSIKFEQTLENKLNNFMTT